MRSHYSDSGGSRTSRRWAGLAGVEEAAELGKGMVGAPVGHAVETNAQGTGSGIGDDVGG